MKLLRFAAENLFSLGRVQLDLTNRGVLLISGYSEDEGSANGAGKSSLASKGPVWVLWGMTPGGLKTDKVVNRHGKKSCWGVVYFTGVDGERYMIKRERPAKLSLFKEDENGKDLSMRKAVDTQELIDRLLGRDFKTFVQTDFFGQGRSMSYAGLKPSEQKALLEQILPLDKIDTWAEYTAAQKKDLDELRYGVLRALDNQEHSIESFHSTRTNFEEKMEMWERRHDKDVASYEEQVNSDVFNRGMNRRLELLDEEIKALAQTCPARTPCAVGRLEEAESAVAQSNKSLGEARTSRLAWEQKLAGYKMQVLDTNKIEENICPTCGTDLTADGQQTLKARNKGLDKQITKTGQTAADAVIAETYYLNQWKKDEQVVTALRQQLNKVQKTNNRIAQLTQEKTEIGASIQVEQGKMHTRLEALKAETNPWIDSLKETNLTIEGLASTIKTNTAKKVALEEEIEHVQFWFDFYSKELKLRLFEATCPFLDQRTTHHLMGLQNRQIHVEFSTIKRLANGDTRDEFAVHVWSETGGDGFASLSGGEQQIVSFAIGLALADLAASQVQGASSFLILDEPFSQLDTRNSEAIVEYLTGELGKGKDTTLLISNEDELKTLIPNRVHVIKKHGVSNIEV
jgi:DNA repair exonuclease SbcCD ATPase subunit